MRRLLLKMMGREAVQNILYRMGRQWTLFPFCVECGAHSTQEVVQYATDRYICQRCYFRLDFDIYQPALHEKFTRP